MSTDCFVSGNNSGPGQSGGLWSKMGGCPWGDLKRDRNLGFVLEDDFVDLPTGVYTATAATTGTFALLAGGEAGLAEADSGATATDRGINVQLAVANVIPAARRKIWFESRVKLIDLVTDAQVFVGLSEIDTSIFAAGENSSANHVGFECNATSIAANPGKLQAVAEKATARATVANVHTLVEDGFVDLGFAIDELKEGHFFVNGVRVGGIVPANIPIVAMAPSFCCLGEFVASSDPILTIDWYRCAVLFV